jgi:predicted nucleic acid-binding protein
MTLIDSNILFDLFTDDPRWAAWSADQLTRLSLTGDLAINDIVYAELSVRFETVEAVDEALDSTRVRLLPMPRAALFLAGKAYRRYRSSGGTRSGVLSDFFIGAHAEAVGMPLLTRDPRRYHTYFPEVMLIAP